MTIVTGSRTIVVTLVCDVTNITEHEDSSNVTCGACACQSGAGSLLAVIEISTTTAQHISYDHSSERVTSQDEFRVRARGSICSNLLVTGIHSVGCLRAVILVAVEHDILVIAAGQTRADGIRDSSYTTWIWLSISTGEEEMNIVTGAFFHPPNCSS